MTELSQKASTCYDEFERPKKDGGRRRICASVGPLKNVQKWLLGQFFYKFQLPQYLHGSIPGRSILTNASEHTGKAIVVNLDIHDFFGSITADMVHKQLLKYSFTPQLVELLVNLTTYKGVLPQGAPTSPAIANLVGTVIDIELLKLLRESAIANQFAYSRYVDDITVSGPAELAELVPAMLECIRGTGFRINNKKIRVQRRSNRQSVTGVVVNEFENVPRGLVRKIRQELYYCKKYGIDDHCARNGLEPFSYTSSLDGKIGFIRMTRPDLADGFKRTLDGLLGRNQASGDEASQALAQPNFVGLDSVTRQTVEVFESFIRGEKTVTFSYPDEFRTLAPSEVFLTSDGRYMVKGFQLSPSTGWRTFDVSQIMNLQEVAG